MTREVVVLRGLGLGDLLTGLPALRAVRRAFPGHRVTLAAPAIYRGLLGGEADDWLDVSGTGPVPADEPDVAVNLHGKGPQSIDALCATRPRRFISFTTGPPWNALEHEVARWCGLLEWYGIPANPADLRLGSCDRTGPIVIHPGASSAARRWPPQRFAKVAEGLAEQAPVVVTCGPGEHELAAHVAATAGVPIAAPALPELARLMSQARLLICGDTGVAHLASAFGTPSVLLFGPVSPGLWGPPEGPHCVLWHGRDGDPHAGFPDPGLLEIDVDEVLAAARDLLEVTRP